MKVAFVHPRAPGGEGTGAAHSATRIVDHLQAVGCDVTVYCLAEPEDGAAGAYDCRRLDVDGFPFHSALALDARLRALAGELAGYDVVHSYLPRTLPAMDRLGRTTPAATVVTLNAYGGVCPKNDLRHLDREACRRNGLLRCAACSLATSGGHADRGRAYRSVSRLGNLTLIGRSDPSAPGVDGLHALSEHVKEIYAGFGYPRRRTTVVPNLLDERFRGEHTSDFSPPYRLLFVGGIEEHKGVLLLPGMLDELERRRPGDFRLTIVGEGGAAGRLDRAIRRRGLGGAVDRRGAVPHGTLPPVYAGHDLFLFPSVWDEPFGRVLLEALAAGTPVVGSDVGAVAEIVGEAGVVTERETGALASSVLDLVEGDELRRRSRAARERAGHFTAAEQGPRLLRLYRDARRRADRRSED